MKALIIHGGWEGHSPDLFAEAYAGMLREEGFDVSVEDTLDVLLGELGELSLIVPIWTMGAIAEPQLRALLDAVESGVGLAGFHGGAGDAFRASPEYQFMVGGQFVAHPDGIKDFDVTIVDRASPITDGLADFSVTSEQYYMHVDPSNHVLATTVFHPETAPWAEGVVMPVAWTRRWGAGAVFYCSIGHAIEELDVPEVAAMQRRGMLWAARG
ncbi:ThuA domain-containing protein [Solirubrobacter soli]|uniref:ThuA domain-containing protein n=1 Tax=Solirubrobacter soli TaxID=363832 RepID=UPI0004252CF8|nr:ThuA domain-containing protein [Solirubrobacter soli]